MVAALLAAPTVSAKKTNEYAVRPSIGNASEITISVTDSIRQGETNRHSFYVGNGVNWLEVLHDWHNSGDSLTLTIYTPKGVNIGTFHDIDDGTIDGKIHIDIVPNNGYVESGIWVFDVYGESVATQRTYDLNVFSH